MRLVLILAMVFLRCTALPARDPLNTGLYKIDDLRVLSPDGRYELRNRENRFVINPRGVDGSFFSEDLPELKDSQTFTAIYAIWSPDSRMVAVCVQTGKYIEDTFVLQRGPRDTWSCFRLPYPDPDAQAVPLRWLDRRTLQLEISGSYGGKAEHELYAYTMNVRYERSKNRFSKLSETKPHQM